MCMYVFHQKLSSLASHSSMHLIQGLPLMRNCLTGSTPLYLKAYNILVFIRSGDLYSTSSRDYYSEALFYTKSIHSSVFGSGPLACPSDKNVYGSSRSIAFVGPSNRNKLPHSLRDFIAIPSVQFHKHLKTSLFVSEGTARVESASD